MTPQEARTARRSGQLMPPDGLQDIVFDEERTHKLADWIRNGYRGTGSQAFHRCSDYYKIKQAAAIHLRAPSLFC